MHIYYCIIILVILACFHCAGFSENVQYSVLQDSVPSLQKELSVARAQYQDAAAMRNKAMIMLAVSGACIIILVAGLYRVEKRAKEYSRWAAIQYKALAVHEQMLAKVDNGTILKRALENQIRVIRELITIYNENSGNIKVFIKHFKEKIMLNTPGEGFWTDLRTFTDINCNNIITRLEKEFPELTGKDLNFIMLTCCGFSYIEMALCLGYANEKSISNRRVAIARKIGTGEPLRDYLKQKITEPVL